MHGQRAPPSNSHRQQLDAFGTPLPAKAPVNFEQRLEKQKSRNSAYKKRLIAVSLVLLFFISAQFMGGMIAGSLALMAGPALMASELLGFGVSISALSSSAQSAQEGGLTFGWHRAEVIGTLLQISTVWILMGWMLVEAFGRFQLRESLADMQGDVMLIVSVMGFIFNLIQMRILHSGESHYDPGEEVVAHAHGGHYSGRHDHDDHSAKRKIKDAEVKKSLIENEEGHQAEHEHDIAHQDGHHSSTDNGFRAVLANLTMSLLLIVIATLAFFFPTYSLLADLSYVFVYAIVIVCMTVPVATEVI